MRLYSCQECEAWLAGHGLQKPGEAPNACKERVAYPPKPYGPYQLAHWIATSLTFRQQALLWITEWSIWRSSENLHLYYRLRETYGDRRLLSEAPGHLFLDHEAEDLASFLQVAMLNGWGGYVLTEANYVNAFFSHDEFIDFFATDDECLADVRKDFGELLLRPTESSPRVLN